MYRLSTLSVAFLFSATALAQGTKQWTQSRFEEFERGTPQNVAIRSDGRLEAAPELRTIFTASATYLWSLDTDSKGDAYIGTGAASGGSQLLRVASDGKSTTLAEFKELGVQAIKLLPDGSVLAATSPDGKLYRIAANAKPTDKPELLFDASQTTEKPKYLWSIALDAQGNVLLATGAPAAIYRIPLHTANRKPELFFHSDDQHIRTLLVAHDGTIYAGSDGAGIVYRITGITGALARAYAYDATGNRTSRTAFDRTPLPQAHGRSRGGTRHRWSASPVTPAFIPSSPTGTRTVTSCSWNGPSR